MKIKINGKEVNGFAFAFDGCHKIYILKDFKERAAATENMYETFDLQKIVEVFYNSCNLRFIRSWDLQEVYVAQGEAAHFEFEFEESEI